MSVEKYFAKVNYQESAKRYRGLCILFLLLSVFIPSLSSSGIGMPASEELRFWFQRSGSLIVLCSSIAEFFAVSMLNVFSQVKMANEPELTTKVKYSIQAKLLIIISAIFISVGTVIWGYGDLII